MIREAGGPEQFQLEDVETPAPRPGWALIRIRAFGLNRSEWFTRRGDSPTVKFPRVLGIECVGEIVDAGGLGLAPGATVAAIMGGIRYCAGLLEISQALSGVTLFGTHLRSFTAPAGLCVE